MEIYETPIKVYIKINYSTNEIIDINSSIFVNDIYNWLEIDSGYGDTYSHAQTQYLPKPLRNNLGEYNYFYKNGIIEDRGI